MHYIYIIRNNVNGKLYVGQANNPKKRWSRHKYDAKTTPDKLVISRAIHKYGAQNFTFTVIEEHPTLEEVNKAEDFWIEFLGTRKPDIGYNIRPGGNNTPTGVVPWNKGTKGVMKANSGSFHVGMPAWNKGIHTGIPAWNKGASKIDWPTDHMLLAMVNDRGLSAVARKLNTDASNVSHRLQIRNLHHNREHGNPDTQFKNGTDHPSAKLTPDQVLEIVALHNTGNYTQAELGRLFGVDRMNIKKIITGQTWSHLTGIKSE